MISASAAAARVDAAHAIPAFGTALPAVMCAQCEKLDQFGRCACASENRHHGFVSTAQMRMLGVNLNSLPEERKLLTFYTTKELCDEDEIEMLGYVDPGFKRSRMADGGEAAHQSPPPPPPRFEEEVVPPLIHAATPAFDPVQFELFHDPEEKIAASTLLSMEASAAAAAESEYDDDSPSSLFDGGTPVSPFAEQPAPAPVAPYSVDGKTRNDKEPMKFRKNKTLDDWFKEKKSEYHSPNELKTAFMAVCHEKRDLFEDWLNSQPEKYKNYDDACEHALFLLMKADRKSTPPLGDQLSEEQQAARQIAAEEKSRQKLEREAFINAEKAKREAEKAKREEEKAEREAIINAEQAKREALKTITPEQFQAIQLWIDAIGPAPKKRQELMTTSGLGEHFGVDLGEAKRRREIFVNMAKKPGAPWAPPAPNEVELKKYAFWPKGPKIKNAGAPAAPDASAPELNPEEEAAYQAARAAALAAGDEAYGNESASEEPDLESELNDTVTGVVDEKNEMEKRLKDAGWTAEDLATRDNFKKKYREWALVNHPDKGGDEENFKKVDAAKNFVLPMFGAFYALFGPPKRKSRGVPESQEALVPEELFDQVKNTLIRILKESPRDERLISSYQNLEFTNTNLAGVFKMIRQKDLQKNKPPFSNSIKDEDFTNLIDKIKRDDFSEIDRLNEIFDDSYFHPNTGGKRKTREASDDVEMDREYEVPADLKAGRIKREETNPIASELDAALAIMDEAGGHCLNATQLAQYAAELPEGASYTKEPCLKSLLIVTDSPRRPQGYEKILFEEATKVLTHYSTVYVKLPYPFFSNELWYLEVDLEQFRHAKWAGLADDGKTKIWDYEGYRGRFTGFDLTRKAFCCELEEAYDGPSTDRKQLFFDIRNEPVAQAMDAWKPWEDAYAQACALHKKTRKWDKELLDEMKDAYEKWAVLTVISPQVEVVDPDTDTPVYGNTDLESIKNFDFLNFIQDAVVVERGPVFTANTPLAVVMKAVLKPQDIELWEKAKNLSKKYTSFVQRQFVEKGWKHSGEMTVHDAHGILSEPLVQELLCHDLMTDDEWKQRFEVAPRPTDKLSDAAANAIDLIRSDSDGRRKQDRLRDTARTTATKLWKGINDFKNAPLMITGTDTIEALEAIDTYHNNIESFIQVQGFVMRQKLNQLLSSTGYIPGDPSEHEENEDEALEGDDLREERDKANTPAHIAAGANLRALQSLDTKVVEAKHELEDAEEARVIAPKNKQADGSIDLAKKALSDAESTFRNRLGAFTLDELRAIISLPRMDSSFKPKDTKATLEKRIHDVIKRKRDDDSEADSGASGSTTSNSRSSGRESESDAATDDASTEDAHHKGDDQVCQEMRKLNEAIKIGKALQELARWVQKWLMKAYPTMNMNANLKKEILSAEDKIVFIYRECHSLFANASNLKRHEAFFKTFVHLWCLQHTIIPAAEKVAVTPGVAGGSMGWITHKVTYSLKEHKGEILTREVAIVSAVQHLVKELTSELDATNPKSLTYFVDDPKGITARLNLQGEQDSFKTVVTPQQTKNLLTFVQTEDPNLLPAPGKKAPVAALLPAAAAPVLAIAANAAPAPAAGAANEAEGLVEDADL
jgi:hypothetical protein